MLVTAINRMKYCKPCKQDIIGFKPEDLFHKDDLVDRCKKLCDHTGGGRAKYSKTGDENEIQRED